MTARQHRGDPRRRFVASVVLGAGALPVLQFVLLYLLVRMPPMGTLLNGSGTAVQAVSFVPMVTTGFAALTAYVAMGAVCLGAYVFVAIAGGLVLGAPAVAGVAIVSAVMWPVLGFAVRN